MFGSGRRNDQTSPLLSRLRPRRQPPMLDRTPFFLRNREGTTPSTPVLPKSVVAQSSSRSPTDDDGSVGRRIKELRRRQGMTQKEVAARVGVTGAQFHRYEVGTTRIAASRLIAIAMVLGVRAEVLMSDASPRPSMSPQIAIPGMADELVEMVELFSALSEDRKRSTALRFLRSLAAHSAVEAYERDDPAHTPLTASTVA